MREKMSEKAKRLLAWMQPYLYALQSSMVLSEELRQYSIHSDEYDTDHLTGVTGTVKAEKRQREIALTEYRLRIARLMEATDWKCRRPEAESQLRLFAVYRFYRGLPLSGKRTATVAHLMHISTARVFQLNVKALNRMAEAWEEGAE